MTPDTVQNPHDASYVVGLLIAIGAVLGVGQVLASGDPVTSRLIIGRAIISGGLGLCAGAVLIVFPDASRIALAGTAAALASLGTSALERIFQSKFPKNAEQQQKLEDDNVDQA